MNPDPLDKPSIENALSSLNDWEYKDNRLLKTFTFSDFREAMTFIVHIGFYAEALNHHPLLTNVYNRVSIELTTHSAANQVTELDVLLAEAIDKVNRDK